MTLALVLTPETSIILVAIIGGLSGIGGPVLLLMLTWRRQDRLAAAVGKVHALAEANHTLANSAATRQLKVEKRGNERELVLLRTNQQLLKKFGLDPAPAIETEIDVAKASIAELTATIAQQEQNGRIADAQIAEG